MYKLLYTTRFKKDLKWQRQNFELIGVVLKLLQQKGVLGIPQMMKPHKLKGNFKNCWECHIKPDLLIIWIQIESPGEIKLIRIGSHSDLFG
jgi:mRNA interferase YafQ